jgi:hypothetical protein
VGEYCRAKILKNFSQHVPGRPDEDLEMPQDNQSLSRDLNPRPAAVQSWISSHLSSTFGSLMTVSIIGITLQR